LENLQLLTLEVIERNKLELSLEQITLQAYSNAPKTMQPRFVEDNDFFSVKENCFEMK